MAYSPRLKEEYKSRVIAALTDEFGYKNVMQVPKLQKIVISKGVGAAVADKKLIDHAVEELTTISGQRAIATMSKKDVASFKLRKGMPIGAKVTLRGERMYEFLDRLVTSALPRVRDFSGIRATGFDGRGNYNLGVTEQIIFPEINIDKVNKISGMDITFVTSAETDKEAKSLLSELGLPFKKN
ncbi:50S ribosomal protein L5 [Hyunsoonleella flava]|uniref:Large ribosomal subunit protein uL5 n=1 Tax=Hyunsoonleella flava TaxID=2527939 RepID=A0A4Q9FCK2_9FLAO|nr:50S ribosomal protein L5 [Hyunsoonleella flava]TBN01381.1 50S ribosomal protein L5 [Hyunsoonleella flava]